MPRIFVGVELDPAVATAVAAAADALRGELIAAHIDVAARWVPRENLHITLWFIGDVSDDRVRAVHDAFGPPFSVPPFDMRLSGLGAFPPSGLPRAFWIGLRSGGERMADLNREVGTRLVPLGFEPESRPYAAHLTIARAKDVTPRSAGPQIRRILRDTPADAGLTRVSAVTLFRSRLSPKGSTYEPLLRVPLR